MKRFIITLVPVPGVDGVRSLRALLKNARHRFGLIATDAREEPDTQAFNELRRNAAARRAARTLPHDEQKGLETS